MADVPLDVVGEAGPGLVRVRRADGSTVVVPGQMPAIQGVPPAIARPVEDPPQATPESTLPQPLMQMAAEHAAADRYARAMGYTPGSGGPPTVRQDTSTITRTTPNAPEESLQRIEEMNRDAREGQQVATENRAEIAAESAGEVGETVAAALRNLEARDAKQEQLNRVQSGDIERGEQEYAAKAKELAAEKPEAFWSRLDTGQKIGAVIAQVLQTLTAGVGRGLQAAGGMSPGAMAPSVIGQMIDQDLALQAEERRRREGGLDDQKGVLAHMRQRFADDAEAYAMARRAAVDRIGQQLSGLAQTAELQDRSEELMTLAEQLRQSQAEWEYQNLGDRHGVRQDQQQERVTRRSGGSGGYTAMYRRAMSRLDEQRKRGEKLQDFGIQEAVKANEKMRVNAQSTGRKEEAQARKQLSSYFEELPKVGEMVSRLEEVKRLWEGPKGEAGTGPFEQYLPTGSEAYRRMTGSQDKLDRGMQIVADLTRAISGVTARPDELALQAKAYGIHEGATQEQAVAGMERLKRELMTKEEIRIRNLPPAVRDAARQKLREVMGLAGAPPTDSAKPIGGTKP